MSKYTTGVWFFSGDLPHANPNEPQSFWKITGPARTRFGYESYPVIKCSKWGKEYKDRNGFSVAAVDAIPEHRVFKGVAGEKAAIDDGIKSSIKKRRIAFLEDRLVRDKAELAELKAWLEQHS